jgi:hypothetical protein
MVVSVPHFFIDWIGLDWIGLLQSINQSINHLVMISGLVGIA